MKVKVIEVFRDLNTNKVYTKNDELDVSKNRYEEIKMFVEPVKVTNKKQVISNNVE